MRFVPIVHAGALQMESALQHCLSALTRGFIGAIFADEFTQFVCQQRTDAAPTARRYSARFLQERGLDCHGDVLFCSHICA